MRHVYEADSIRAAMTAAKERLVKHENLSLSAEHAVIVFGRYLEQELNLPKERTHEDHPVNRPKRIPAGTSGM